MNTWDRRRPGFIKGRISYDGYHNAVLRIDGKPKTIKVHRLVAHAFIPNPNGLETVNHKDGNKLNNSADNLEWMSQVDFPIVPGEGYIVMKE